MSDDRLHSEGLRDLAALHEARKRIRDLEDERGTDRRFERHDNNNGPLLKLILAVVSALLISFILSGIYLYREVGEVKALGAENARVGAENARRVEWLYQQFYNSRDRR